MAHSRDVEALDSVTFADLLCLYVNHRPLFNVSHGDIVTAFKDLGARGDAGASRGVGWGRPGSTGVGGGGSIRLGACSADAALACVGG